MIAPTECGLSRLKCRTVLTKQLTCHDTLHDSHVSLSLYFSQVLQFQQPPSHFEPAGLDEKPLPQFALARQRLLCGDLAELRSDCQLRPLSVPQCLLRRCLPVECSSLRGDVAVFCQGVQEPFFADSATSRASPCPDVEVCQLRWRADRGGMDGPDRHASHH